MFKYLALVLVLVFSTLLWMYFTVGVPVIYNGAETRQISVHRMGEEAQSIARIHITAFYFVPKNKTDTLFLEWKSILKKNLDDLVRFHDQQLQGASSLEYEIYPVPIIGREDNLAYDTELTQHGNPEALRHIVPEIESRIFDSTGDLYRSDLKIPEANMYHVYVILYEGVGAIGGGNAALLNRKFLSDTEWEAVDGSLLAHEFYHTLGLPDEYTIPEDVPVEYTLAKEKPISASVMGLGRYRPIRQTFIGSRLLAELGL